MLNQVVSYPTLIFVDRKDQVSKIHTGFKGPATAEYPAFKKEFEAIVADLLSESASTIN